MTETGFYRLPASLAQDIETHAAEVAHYRSGEMTGDAFKGRRVPRGVYEERQADRYMTRVRVAAGALTPAQVRLVADLGRALADGTLHVTTRQDVQFHRVRLEDTPEIMRRLAAVGLGTRGGGGNTVRNMTACPLAGVCPHECFDVTAAVFAATEYLLTLEGSFGLPRKLKMAFSGCAADCAFALANDAGFVATVRDGQPGFALYGGGGFGAGPRLADLLVEFLPAADTVRAAEAMRRLFDRTGDRQDRHRARLRHAVRRLGVEEFRRLYLAELEQVRADAAVPACAVPAVLAPTRAPVLRPPPEQSTDGLTTIDQRQPDRVTVRLYPDLGHVAAADFARLGELAAAYSEEHALHTTQAQGLLLRSVPRARLPDLARELRTLGQDLVSRRPHAGFISCTGAATCRLGLCLSRNLARAAAEALERAAVPDTVWQELDVRVSGCPNSCGQHVLGGIGLSGALRRHDDGLIPGYRLSVGARRGVGRARFAQDIGFIPGRALPDCLVALARGFAAGRAPGESWPDYVDRVGAAHIEALTAPFTPLPTHAERPDYYRDWGQDREFSVEGVGPGPAQPQAKPKV